MKPRCVLETVRQAPAAGPFGAFETGARADSVHHWPGYLALDEMARKLIDLAWAGQRRKVLVASADRSRLHLVRHAPTGARWSGRQYGYTVQTLKLAVPAPSRRISALWTLLVAVPLGFLAGNYVRFDGADVPPSPSIEAPGEAPFTKCNEPDA